MSRALPKAATTAENEFITRARQLMGAYDKAELMLQAGLYSKGSDPLTDTAVKAWPNLDAFVGDRSVGPIDKSFETLASILAVAEGGKVFGTAAPPDLTQP